MSNWFSGINQAASGLNAARYSLSVIGQNMTNASTTGYTREVVNESAAVVGNSLSGVTVTSTTRVTDAVLDSRVRSAAAGNSLASTTSSQLSDIENVFGEPSTTGIASQLDTFWSAWGTLANTSTSASTTGVNSARQNVLSDAAQLASSLNTAASSLSNLATSTSASLSSDISSVNTTVTQLATLNGQIAAGTATGSNVAAMEDQRDQLLTTLANTVGASAQIQSNGSATVSLGGQTLVSGTTASSLTLNSDNSVSMTSGTTTTPVTITSGTAGAEITNLTSTLPTYRAQLDAVANQLASTVNSAQTSGYDANGNAGKAMFTGSGAAGITLALSDPATVAASSSSTTQDNAIAQTLSQAGTGSGAPDASYRALIGSVATATAAATNTASTQSTMSSYVNGLKSSLSGVSIDEEAANMLSQQQAFDASSRVLTTINDMLSTLINNTGVGS